MRSLVLTPRAPFVGAVCAVMFLALLLFATKAEAQEPTEPEPQPTELTAAPAPPVANPPPAWGFEGPYRLDVGVSLGFASRADEPPLFTSTNDAGLSGGFGLRLYTSERVGLGLAYEHIGLWREESGLLTTGSVELSRAFDTLWASLRLRPLRGDEVGVYVDLGAGPSWQRVSLQGVVWDAVTPGLRLPLRCDAGGDIGFGFRGQAGLELPLTESFGLDLGAGLDLYRHSSDVIGGCAPGAGSAVVPTVRLGLAYGWEL